MVVPASIATEIALAVPYREGQVLVAWRSEGRIRGGCWEFPGGKLHQGEDPDRAARRELREETGLTAERWEPLIVFDHDDGRGPLRLHVYLAEDLGGEVHTIGDVPYRWCTPSDLHDSEMPPANQAILRALNWRVS